MQYVTRLVFAFYCAFFATALFADHVVPRLIIVGDSLSTTHHSWPNVLDDLSDRWVIHVMAQNGRTIRDFSFPRDLWTAGDKNDTVVYFIGSNDILQRNNIGFAKYRLQFDISFLLERNFKVLLVMPPSFGLDENKHGKSNREHREIFEAFRGTHPRLWVYDINRVWDPSDTSDGVHPNDQLSIKIAKAINDALLKNIY